MKKKRQGFTLIELLAVIVILGLLMAIAIPSVTKYITQSRKKTVSTTIGNYIGALTNQVNDMEYTFTAANTVYAVPIECIALERGGTNPFGEWHQASDSYWAYVLVQYDDSTSSYTYGFTFKDSAGYGLYPTTSEKLNENGSQINTGLNLNRPRNGTITNITTKDNWNGFILDDNTQLHVLESESEGNVGDGINTCTLCQKGDNYDAIEEEKSERNPTLAYLIKKHNPNVKNNPTLTTSSNETGEKGLYSSTDTNSGNPTYYFRGNVSNNYVEFAGFTWRIVRINEDGTIRLIVENGIELYNKFNSVSDNYKYMYYSNSDIKIIVDNWYQTNIISKNYDKYVVAASFCEQAKVTQFDDATGVNTSLEMYTTYSPSFKCSNDGNGYGILNGRVGLITIDEVIYAGGHFMKSNTDFYLYGDKYFWTMSPGGFKDPLAAAWIFLGEGCGWLMDYGVAWNPDGYRPVINLNANVLATGTGTSSDPYVIQTN